MAALRASAAPHNRWGAVSRRGLPAQRTAAARVAIFLLAYALERRARGETVSLRKKRNDEMKDLEHPPRSGDAT